MHYLAPGKKNLVVHLDITHKELLHTRKDLNKWTKEELENVHKEMHKEEINAQITRL